MERKRNLAWFALELVVVFLGVTAAFVLDNWGEARRERAEERRYLEGLYRDAQRDSASLKKMSDLLGEKLTLLERLLTLREQPDSLAVIEKLLPQALFSTILFKPSNDTWESLKAGGDLKLLEDLELRRSLTKLDKLYYGIDKAQEELQSFGRRELEPWALSNLDLSTFRFQRPAAARSTRFWNFLAANVLLTRNHKQMIEDASEALEEVLKRLRRKLR